MANSSKVWLSSTAEPSRQGWRCARGERCRRGSPGLSTTGRWTSPTVTRQPIAVSDISIYICLIDISFRSKSKEQLNERRAGLSNCNQLRRQCKSGVSEVNVLCSLLNIVDKPARISFSCSLDLLLNEILIKQI